MGEVWKAEDTRLGRIVAIKVLPAAVSADVEAVGRLKREARTAAQLYHPNIAMIHAIEQEGDLIFIVEELVEGEPLSRMIARGPIPEADLCRIGRGVAEALAAAHEKEIVHRDIKPDNIIVNGNRVKVLDFGIAKQLGDQASSSTSPTAFMTQQGMIIGTVQYMSPEQALGKPLDFRTDIFSLGVVLYEAATGRLPFGGDTLTDTITRIIRDEPPLPAASAGLTSIIVRCMQKNRDDRFASAAEVADALDKQMQLASTSPYTNVPPPAPARPPAPPTVIAPASPPRRSMAWVWVAAAVIVLLGAAIVAGVWTMQRPKPKPAPPAPVKAVAVAPKAAVTVTAPPSTISEVPPTPAPVTQTTETTETTAPHPASGHPLPAERGEGEQQPQPAETADSLYNQAMSDLMSADQKDARQTLHRVVEIDPHYARAYMRIGEIALINRRCENATPAFEKALADADRLDSREKSLVELGMAICSNNGMESHRIAREIRQANPGDVDLERIGRSWPGMVLPMGRFRR